MPPATPKTPEDLAAVPAHPPATAPAKYDDFVQKKAEGETPLIDRMAAADVPDEESEEQQMPGQPSLADLIAQVQAEAEPGTEAAPTPRSPAGGLCTY